MPFLLWIIEQSAAAAMGYYVGRYLANSDRAKVKAMVAQKKAAAAAAKARSLTAQAAVEGEWEEFEEKEIDPTEWAVEEFRHEEKEAGEASQ